MSFSSMRFGQFCDFRPKVCFFRIWIPKGMKSCHFHSAHELNPFVFVKSRIFSSFLLT
ncbi:hypothetical protein Hanom_Chr06g00577091 [Helianthus anomalus]